MNAASISSLFKPCTSSLLPLSSSTSETSGDISRNARITRGTNGWKGAELVKPTTTRPCSPRAVRRVVASRAVDLIENDACPIEKGDAGVGQLHAARLAAEQLHLELLLQCADLHAQRRLLDAQAFRGPGHVLFFSDGNEIAEVAQFHMPYVSDIDF